MPIRIKNFMVCFGVHYSETGPRPHTSLYPVVSEGTWLEKNNYAQFDGWELRQLINFVAADDGVPEPEIIIEVLKGCRNNNDYALAIRFLEVVRLKGGNKMSEIWPYIMQEIGPTMQELGISTLKEMGYEEPELWLENVSQDSHRFQREEREKEKECAIVWC